MNHKQQWLSQNFGAVGLWHHCDRAIIGVAYRQGMEPTVVYDRQKLIKEFIRQGMSDEEAEEWCETNIETAWIGEVTPLILRRVPTRSEIGDKLDLVAQAENELERLRNARTPIAETKDEPYSSDFAKDILSRRIVP